MSKGRVWVRRGRVWEEVWNLLIVVFGASLVKGTSPVRFIFMCMFCPRLESIKFAVLIKLKTFCFITFLFVNDQNVLLLLSIVG